MKLFTLDAPGFEISWEEKCLVFLPEKRGWLVMEKQLEEGSLCFIKTWNVSDCERVEDRGRMYGENI